MHTLRLPADSAAPRATRPEKPPERFPTPPAPRGGREVPEFSGLDRTDGFGRSAASALSMVGHAVILLLLVLVPLFRPGDLIDLQQRDYLRVLIYDPPPPPPPPLPRGTLGLARPKPREAAPKLADTPPLSESRLQAPIEAVSEPVIVASDNDAEQAGSPTGSDLGVPEGMEGGVEGGVVGGVLGGVLGGVIGGTGTGPVPVHDYDRAPRVLRQTKPRYPPDAFVQKIQGTVLVEILIDDTGRVARARVVQSVPALDAAALEAVRDWTFVPAYKRGRPVATVARAPVSFRIY